MTDTTPQDAFISAAGLVAESEDAVTLGSLTPGGAPAGVDALIQAHISEIDALLKKLPHESMDALELLIRRGFTYDEYQQFFQPFRKGHEQRPAYRAMVIETDERRREVIYNLTASHDDYVTLLSRALRPFHPSLGLFFSRTSPRAHFPQRPSSPRPFGWA